MIKTYNFFKDNITALIDSGLDLVFCNEIEAESFTGKESLSDAIEAMKSIAKTFVITLGNKGAVIWDGEKSIEIKAHKVEAVDSNGAGDMFAGAFLYGLTNGMDFEAAGNLASAASAKIVSQFGPRLEKSQMQEILKNHGAM